MMKIDNQILKILFVLVLTCKAYSQDINNTKLEIFNFLDNCLKEHIKDSINKTDENEFSRYTLSAKNINLTVDDFKKYCHCFYYIDTLIHKNNGQFIDLFKDYPTDFNIDIMEIFFKSYYRYLKKLPDNFELYLDSLRKLKLWSDSIDVAWAVADTINGYYIPKDIEDTYKQIYIIFDSSRIAEFINISGEEKAISIEHFGLGLNLRSTWKLGASRLNMYFTKNYGIHNHDLISSFILTYWYRRLKNIPLKLNEIILKYQGYQKLNNAN